MAMRQAFLGKLMKFAGTEEQKKTLARAQTLLTESNAGEGEREEESLITKKLRQMSVRRPTLGANG